MIIKNYPDFPELEEPVVLEELNDLRGDINEVLDRSCPVNPNTGLRDNILDRLDSSDITESERKTILENMSKMPVSERYDVSDDVLLEMLPSRYASTQVDMQAVRNYYNNLILEELKNDGKGAVGDK